MFSYLWHKIKTNIQFRLKLFLCLSCVFNLAYSGYLLAVSQIKTSFWLLIMAVYYGLLSVVRLFMFSQARSQKDKLRKIKTMRTCGFFLLLINLVVSVMMFLLIHKQPPVKHHEITVITLATYTFSALTVSIVSGIKYLKRNNYIYSSIKAISLVSASVSLVTLTSTMLATFGEDNSLLRSVTLPMLSGAVFITIVIGAILMIRKANSLLRTIKNEKEGQ